MKQGWRDFLVIGSVCLILGVTALLILSHLGNEVQEDMDLKCNALGGKLVFYECLHAGDVFVKAGDRCANKITGYVCELPDGSEVQFTYDALAGEVRP